MRMKELSRRSGFSPSTIHHYLQEGLLPPPERPTRNSALYSTAHLDRLALIAQMKQRRPGMPLPAMRRVLELVDQGIEAPVAIALQGAVTAGLAESGTIDDRTYDLEELAEAAGLPPERLAPLVEAGVILSATGDEQRFDGSDLTIARLLARLFQVVPVDPADLGEIAGHLRAASAKEMELRNRASQVLDAAGAAELSGHLQEWANLWHAYQFARLRQREILVHGLGIAPEDGPIEPDHIKEGTP